MKEIRIEGAEETIFEKKLKNGMKIYIWPSNLTEEISMTLTVKYGSIHTNFQVGNKKYTVPKGMAHFLEHIKFNEKKGLTAHDYYQKLGSYTNAYTTFDHTSYEVSTNSNIKENLEHLLYFVLNPYFTKSLIQKEKGIIVSECKMTLDNPYNVGYFTLLKNLYEYNNKKYLVTGNVEDIKKITIEDALNVFNNFYHPANMFLTVTGNVNPFEIEKIVEEFFKDKTYPKYVKPKIISQKESDKVLKKYEEIKTNVTKEKLVLGFKIPRNQFPKIDDLHLRIYFYLVLNCNFGVTSEFNDYLLKNELIDDLYYSISIEKENVVIIFESSTSYPNKLCEMIEDKMNNLSLTEEDFIRKNKVLKSGVILSYENINDVNADIRNDIISYDKIINNAYGIFKIMKKSDCDDIINNIKKFSYSTVILKPNL